MAFQRNMDYIDVASRLMDMREKYPDLTMSQLKLDFVNIGGKDYVVYTAAAFRTPDDLCPGVGTAWEPIPGPTPYTRDSEVQNAETAAWGRAMVAIGSSTKHGIASAEEVTNRQGPSDYETGQHTRPAGVNAQTGELDPRIDAILQAAVIGGNNFVTDLANKYNQYGNLSEAQMEKGFNAAAKILGNETQIKQRVTPAQNAPEREYEFSEPEERF